MMSWSRSVILSVAFDGGLLWRFRNGTYLRLCSYFVLSLDSGGRSNSLRSVLRVSLVFKSVSMVRFKSGLLSASSDSSLPIMAWRLSSRRLVSRRCFSLAALIFFVRAARCCSRWSSVLVLAMA